MNRVLGIIMFVLLGYVPSVAAEEATLYLVRHAEKIADSDPGLTEQGQTRAKALAALLKGKGITKVFSTNYKRTLQTAAPLAEQGGLQIIHYNPRELNAFAQRLKQSFLRDKQSVLVVGHSNTTPYLATLLTGEEFPLLKEDQYDHLYKVVIGEDGELKASIEYFNP